MMTSRDFQLGLVIGLALGLTAGMAVAWAVPARGDPVDHVHSSSRYDRSPESLSRQAHRFARTRTDMVTWTEVSDDRRARVLRVAGWRSFTPDGTDVGMSWPRRQWRTRMVDARTLSRHRFTTINGFVSPLQRAAVVVLQRRRGGERVVLVAAHLPAIIDAERRARLRAWRGALSSLSDLVPRLQDRWHPDLVIVAADWNIDLRRPARREQLRRAFPGLSLTWRRPLPAGGTHERGGLIDGTLTSGRGRARLISDDASSDHRPYREVVRPRDTRKRS